LALSMLSAKNPPQNDEERTCRATEGGTPSAW
jgi:hypothetical protein